MIEFHKERRAEVTVAAFPVEAHLSAEFGVIEAAPDGAIVGFHEKVAAAPTVAGDPRRVYASMGNYIFSARTLLRELHADAQKEGSHHDFGRDILPSLIGRVPMFAYDFQKNQIPGEPTGQPAYWKDVGTLEAYYETHMELCGLMPALNLYNRRWPIRSASYPDPSGQVHLWRKWVSRPGDRLRHFGRMHPLWRGGPQFDPRPGCTRSRRCRGGGVHRFR